MVVELAAAATQKNSQSGGALCATCLVTLATLLALVRKFARKRGVMSAKNRAAAHDIATAIDDHLELRSSELGSPTGESVTLGKQEEKSSASDVAETPSKSVGEGTHRDCTGSLAID